MCINTNWCFMITGIVSIHHVRFSPFIYCRLRMWMESFHAYGLKHISLLYSSLVYILIKCFLPWFSSHSPTCNHQRTNYYFLAEMHTLNWFRIGKEKKLRNDFFFIFFSMFHYYLNVCIKWAAGNVYVQNKYTSEAVNMATTPWWWCYNILFRRFFFFFFRLKAICQSNFHNPNEFTIKTPDITHLWSTNNDFWAIH